MGKLPCEEVNGSGVISNEKNFYKVSVKVVDDDSRLCSLFDKVTHKDWCRVSLGNTYNVMYCLMVILFGHYRVAKVPRL